jgi:hypothetical protein
MRTYTLAAFVSFAETGATLLSYVADILHRHDASFGAYGEGTEYGVIVRKIQARDLIQARDILKAYVNGMLKGAGASVSAHDVHVKIARGATADRAPFLHTDDVAPVATLAVAPVATVRRTPSPVVAPIDMATVGAAMMLFGGMRAVPVVELFA